MSYRHAYRQITVVNGEVSARNLIKKPDIVEVLLRFIGLRNTVFYFVQFRFTSYRIKSLNDLSSRSLSLVIWTQKHIPLHMRDEGRKKILYLEVWNLFFGLRLSFCIHAAERVSEYICMGVSVVVNLVPRACTTWWTLRGVRRSKAYTLGSRLCRGTCLCVYISPMYVVFYHLLPGSEKMSASMASSVSVYTLVKPGVYLLKLGKR